MELQLANPVLDLDRRASIGSACSKLVTQYKFDLICLDLQIIQETQRGYRKLLSTLLKEVSESPWPDPVKQAIMDRHKKMVERYELYLAHKLNTFFVEAPMV